MRDLRELDEYRQKNVRLLSISFFNGNPKSNGVFHIRLKCSHRWFNVIATSGGGWDHVSVNPDHHTRTPTWDEMCEIKDLFFLPEEEVVEYHPKRSEYVNLAQHCLHLWRPNDGRELLNPIREAKARSGEDMATFMKRLENGDMV